MTLMKQVIRVKSLRVVLATLGTLTLVIEAEPELFRAHSCFNRRYFFLFFQAFLLEVSPFSERKECGYEEYGGSS